MRMPKMPPSDSRVIKKESLHRGTVRGSESAEQDKTKSREGKSRQATLLVASFENNFYVCHTNAIKFDIRMDYSACL